MRWNLVMHGRNGKGDGPLPSENHGSMDQCVNSIEAKVAGGVTLTRAIARGSHGDVRVLIPPADRDPSGFVRVLEEATGGFAE